MKFDFNAATNDPEFVKLETSDQNRIGRIDKLIATKKSYVIADYYLANSVFFFDKSGKFLNRVSAVDGQAVPLVFDGMSYDNNKSIVYVHFHNNDESYLNSYTETGEFLGKHKSNGLYFSDFAIMPDSSFAFFMPGDKSKSIVNDYELAFGNREGKTQSVAFSYNSTSTLSNYGYNYNLVTFDDYILYSKSYSKYIYQISNQPIRIFPVLS
ncbi:6-bladed beta-propeller [Niabella sp. W65]|nr:6-bladed beta-propeller [Niabella sp. W65]MCH7366433.1 6-bladed beta-propeller [Niabella sp. W65]ULT42153.1 6-bladed beta-propeller [Niabella sp. I65]